MTKNLGIAAMLLNNGNRQYPILDPDKYETVISPNIFREMVKKYPNKLEISDSDTFDALIRRGDNDENHFIMKVLDNQNTVKYVLLEYQENTVFFDDIEKAIEHLLKLPD